MKLSLLRSAACLAALASLSLPTDAASGETSATYRVVFKATWSSTTHPGAYPGNAHFSPLVGGTHNGSVTFWEDGGISSPGMETMAETGGQFPLGTEVGNAVTAGTAGEVILGAGGILSPGQTDSTTFTVTDAHPLVSLVTMVAPSPDWFVGVDSLALLQGGEWVDDLEVDLYCWDAGTDSGPNFTSGNQNTNPKEPIALLTGGPFFGTTPLGTFTFRRIESTLTYGCGVNPTGSLTITSGRPRLNTTLTVELSDPTGTMGLPSATFLALSPRSAAGFPCGTLVPNWGMSAVGAAGELGVQNPLFIMVGGPYTGAGVSYSVQIPNDPALISRALYMQGMLIDGTKRRGLTEPLEIFVGP